MVPSGLMISQITYKVKRKTTPLLANVDLLAFEMKYLCTHTDTGNNMHTTHTHTHAHTHTHTYTHVFSNDFPLHQNQKKSKSVALKYL